MGQDQVSGGVSILCWHANKYNYSKTVLIRHPQIIQRIEILSKFYLTQSHVNIITDNNFSMLIHFLFFFRFVTSYYMLCLINLHAATICIPSHVRLRYSVLWELLNTFHNFWYITITIDKSFLHNSYYNTCIYFCCWLHPILSMPMRKPPLWHFTYWGVICLQSYDICKDGNITIFWRWRTVACTLYYYLCGTFFNLMIA